MPTNVMTKREYIDLLEETIKDDEFVYLTGEVNEVEFKPRLEVKQVKFSFAANGFKNTKGVNDIVRSRPVAVLLVKQKDMSEMMLEQFAEHKNSLIYDNSC